MAIILRTVLWMNEWIALNPLCLKMYCICVVPLILCLSAENVQDVNDAAGAWTKTLYFSWCVCTRRCLLKRDIWKTSDCSDKVSMTVLFCYPFLQSFLPTNCLLPLFVSLNTPPPSLIFALYFPSFLHLPGLPNDGCWWHLCSVSQMSRSTNWNINLAVNMAEKWWGGGRGVSVLLSAKVPW